MYTRTDLIEERDSLKRQWQKYHRNLLHLQEQKANYGLNAPLQILNDIGEAEANIKRIEARLQEIDTQLESLPPEPEPSAERETTPTAEQATQPTVFISYSHQDEADKEQLLSHLGVLQREGLIDVWVDDRLDPGSDQAIEIDRAIGQARVAVLLITANFLNSNILQTEVPRLLERRRHEGLIVFPVIARPCAWRKVDWLARMKVRPKHEAPVWREGGRYVDEELATIAEEVAEIIERARQSDR